MTSPPSVFPVSEQPSLITNRKITQIKPARQNHSILSVKKSQQIGDDSLSNNGLFPARPGRRFPGTLVCRSVETAKLDRSEPTKGPCRESRPSDSVGLFRSSFCFQSRDEILFSPTRVNKHPCTRIRSREGCTPDECVGDRRTVADRRKRLPFGISGIFRKEVVAIRPGFRKCTLFGVSDTDRLIARFFGKNLNEWYRPVR